MKHDFPDPLESVALKDTQVEFGIYTPSRVSTCAFDHFSPLDVGGPMRDTTARRAAEALIEAMQSTAPTPDLTHTFYKYPARFSSAFVPPPLPPFLSLERSSLIPL